METWTCHICGKERPDGFIAVMSYSMKGLPGCMFNVRYCADDLNCQKEAIAWCEKGEFPHKVKQEKVKKWWQFWK